MSLYNRVKENCEVVGKVIQINLKVKRIYFKKLLLKKVTINNEEFFFTYLIDVRGICIKIKKAKTIRITNR